MYFAKAIKASPSSTHTQKKIKRVETENKNKKT